jgi:hypothetical protein
VTRNSDDFRGHRETPGSKGQFSNVSLHAGLICLNARAGMDLALQRELFSEVLDELDTNGDMTNQILEVTLEDSEAGASRSSDTSVRRNESLLPEIQGHVRAGP